MDIDRTALESAGQAQTALNTLAPVQLLMLLIGVVVLILLIYSAFRFRQGARKLAKATNPAEFKAVKAGQGEAMAAQASKATKAAKATVSGADYAGLTREEMKMVFEAEVRKRKELGEELIVRDVFEGPLDWEDVDESGTPRVRAEKPPDFEEWQKQQQAKKT